MAEFDGGITVLMPVYNCSNYLPAAIRSVVNQTYSEFEFIIIDDGSTDGSAGIAASFNDSRIKLHVKEHTGLADTLNAGIKIAAGKWIARIDADDIAVRNRLQLQAEYIVKHPSVNVLGGYSVYFNEKGKVEFAVRPPSDNEGIRKMLNVHNPINHSTVTFMKQLIIDNGGYDSEMICFEDFELWLRLRDKLHFAIVPEILAYTRLHSKSMTSGASYSQLRSILTANLRQLENSGQRAEDLKEIGFRIDYFYGRKDDARKRRPQLNSFPVIAAYLSTLLPEKSFQKLKRSRIRYKLMTSAAERKLLNAELSDYLSQ